MKKRLFYLFQNAAEGQFGDPDLAAIHVRHVQGQITLYGNQGVRIAVLSNELVDLGCGSVDAVDSLVF